MTPEVCPNCGADLPRRAKACPECGSCPETGWSDESYLDGAGVPEEEFDYDAYVEKEFGSEKPAMVPAGIHWAWWLVAVLLILALLMFLF